MRNKIYLQGYYGHNNLGDDYLFYSIVDEIGRLNHDYALTVDVEGPSFDDGLYQSIVRHFGNVGLKSTLAGGLRGKLRRVLAVLRSDYYVIGGGVIS